MIFISCNGVNNSKTTSPDSVKNKDTIFKPVTIADIRNAAPTFKNFPSQQLNIQDTLRYLRIILNTNKLVKTWMVYFDRIERTWNTLTWQGTGENFTILVDTVFNQLVGIENSFEDPPNFYMAESSDDGKTWESLDMSLVPLSGCKLKTLKSHQKSAQLIISNDFMNSSHLPSICIAWQWNHRRNLKGQGIATTFDFSAFCSSIQELEIIPNN